MRAKLKEKIRRIAALCFLFVLCAATVLGGQFSAPLAYADISPDLKYDETNVLDDLQSSTIDGKPFDVRNYPRNPYGTAQMITFVEYCYSQYANGNGNYTLYVYVYNPALVDFATASVQNKIEISTEFYYSREVGHVGDVKEYAKFPLKFCNASEGEYKNLFLKFKVVDDNGVILKGQREHEEKTGSRYYHISGIELSDGAAANAHDYWVNKYYQFSGYAEGYGDSSKFPFRCDATGEGEAVQLNVQHTFYRTETSSKGANYQNQLDTVYFAVPKRLFDTYGKLQRIKAEWYEYKTKDYLVTSNTEFFNAAQQYIANKVPSGTGDPPDMSLSNVFTDKGIGYALGSGLHWGINNMLLSADWGWNLDCEAIDRVCEIFTLLFLVDNIEDYDPYAENTDGTVNGNDLYNKIKAYDRSFENGTLPIKDGTISADLFEDDIDESRKTDSEQGKIQKGYSYYDFDADTDLQKLVSWKDGDPSFWENWEEFGFWDALFGNIPSEVGREVSPIQVLEESDLAGTAVEVSQRLLVNVKDVPDIKAAYDDAVTVDPSEEEDEECYLVLFRFATSDYYSAPVNIFKKSFSSTGWNQIWSQAYVFNESVFFDFDVIQLTFNNDGKYHVIPVVSDPIDIIDDATPPPDIGSDPGCGGVGWTAFWVIVLIIIAVVIVIIIVTLIKARLSRSTVNVNYAPPNDGGGGGSGGKGKNEAATPETAAKRAEQAAKRAERSAKSAQKSANTAKYARKEGNQNAGKSKNSGKNKGNTGGKAHSKAAGKTDGGKAVGKAKSRKK